MEALRFIFSNPRPLEVVSHFTLGLTPENHAEMILKTTSPMVVTLDGEPVMYFHHHRYEAQRIIIYGAGGTPVLDRFPVAFTRCGRDLIRETIAAYPDDFHLTVADPEGFARLWLHRIGFRDTDQFHQAPGGRLQWLVAHVPGATT